MITGVHHIAIIVSSEDSIVFYEQLGFAVLRRFERKNDTVVIMEGNGIELEMFIDPTHPNRATDPENIGLRHLALKVDNVEKMSQEYECGPIMVDWFNRKYCFTKDPDGLPIEFHE